MDSDWYANKFFHSLAQVTWFVACVNSVLYITLTNHTMTWIYCIYEEHA